MRVLILGGTREARDLAAALVDAALIDELSFTVTTSLAGRVSDPALPAGETVIGGFGGVAGLRAFLRTRGIDVVVDATHPFAATMSAHAVAACASTSVDEEPGGQAAAPEPAPARAHSPLAQPSPAEPGPAEGSAAPGPTGPGPTKGSTGEGSPSGDRQHEDGYGGDRPREGGAVPLLRLARPGWTRRPGDDWHRVPHLAAAAERARALCPPGSAVFVTTGRRQLAPFAADPDRHYVIRAVDPPADLLPTRHTVLLDRGPYTIDGETRLLRDHRIRVLVTKDSGGDLTVAKLDAARALGLPVVMVDRPTVTGPVPPTWPNVDGVLAALRELASAVA